MTNWELCVLCQKQSEKNSSVISRIRVGLTSVARVHIRKSSGLQINSKTYPYPDVEH